MNDEGASRAGKEMASMIRAAFAGQSVDQVEIWNAFQHMTASEATTAADALALISVARVIAADTVENLDLKADDIEGFKLLCAQFLIAKAAAALEAVTGEREGHYTGRAPALN